MKKTLLITSVLLGFLGVTGALRFRSLVHGSDGPPEGPPVEITIPAGASFTEVLDTLETRCIVRKPGLFRIYARLKGADRLLKAGPYAFPRPTPWARLIRDLTEGRVLTQTMTIPEGFTLKQMAPLCWRTSQQPLWRRCGRFRARVWKDTSSRTATIWPRVSPSRKF